jgi:uncharacterized protein YgiM (DUF1202 family)
MATYKEYNRIKETMATQKAKPEEVKNEVKTEESKPEVKKEPRPRKKTKKYAVVTAERLYLRSSPMKANNVLTIFDKGRKIEVLSEENDGWYKVSIDNGAVIGYVMKEFVDLV